MKINSIYEGDNLKVLRKFPDKSVDLIYADPPFFSNQHYVVHGEDGLREFTDKWKGGIDSYIVWIKERMIECRRILKDTGSIYLHCDYHANGYLRVIMDQVFGIKNMRNEIVWKRTYAHGGGTKGFSRVHDTILFYSKTDQFKFNKQYNPYSKEYVKGFFKKSDSDGRRYQLVIATGPGETKNDYEWKGKKPPKGRHWAYNKTRMEELEKEGRLVYSKNGIPRVKQYIDEKPGTLISDIWNDIDVIHSLSKERQKYPTQKPLPLLERIISSSSDEGDIVLDPFCGCGTTLVAAQKLKRKWIGIDINSVACSLMKKRMTEFNIDTSIIKVDQGD
ncbi:site-specific DNA-methyltransferase [Candidatus Parvarchaeota archaeon]|nr:site-specific DNA-methyltransferase [Candidatus Parvarchaeota archaeon]